MKKKKISEYIPKDLEISSNDSDREENSDEGNSDEEDSN